MSDDPLVTIGVPTYNQASRLRKALESLAAQDYSNLEIVISDNASADNTPEVCGAFQQVRPFVRYHRNASTIPAFNNFEKVLLLAKGHYFMWAADDDLWDSTFVSTLVDYMRSDANLVLVAAEAQYMLEDGTRLPFFAEGQAFYRYAGCGPPLPRLLAIAGHNYGNLIYGLYRREALLRRDGHTVMSVCRFTNEIPVFIQVCSRGHVRVCPKVLFYKTAALPTYLQAAREYGVKQVVVQPRVGEVAEGSKTDVEQPASAQPVSVPRARRLMGFITRFGTFGLTRCRHSATVYHYHTHALGDIRRAIWTIDISLPARLVLLAVFTKQLVAHLFKLVVVWQVQDILPRKSRH